MVAQEIAHENDGTQPAPRSGNGKRLKLGVAAGLGAAVFLTAGFVSYQAWAAPPTITSSLFGNSSVTFKKAPVIRVDNGTIKSVVVTPVGGGDEIQGTWKDDGARFRLDTSGLDFNTKYRVVTTVVGNNGTEVVQKNRFRTFAPTSTLSTTVNVARDGNYGVGMPITLSFSEPITHRAAIEKRLKVSTDAAEEVEGSWSWEGGNQVTYRPKDYWPANTTVKLVGNIKGVPAGEGTTPDMNVLRTIHIGDRQVMLVNSNTHMMKFKRNGKLIRTMPISLGKPGHETMSGTKVIMTRETDALFTADVPKTDPEYYKLRIAYAMRLTWSGEYIHSAPWSVADQGVSNVSHGCTNVSMDDGRWLYDNTQVGDIVKISNTGVPQDDGDGITVWNESWSQWRAGSAL